MTHWEGHFRSTERIGPSGQKEEKPPSRTCDSAQPPPPPPAPPGLGPAPSFPSPRQPTFERCPFCTDPKHNSAKPGGGGADHRLCPRAMQKAMGWDEGVKTSTFTRQHNTANFWGMRGQCTSSRFDAFFYSLMGAQT